MKQVLRILFVSATLVVARKVISVQENGAMQQDHLKQESAEMARIERMEEEFKGFASEVREMLSQQHSTRQSLMNAEANRIIATDAEPSDHPVPNASARVAEMFEGCTASRIPKVVPIEEPVDAEIQEAKASELLEMNSSEYRCGVNELVLVEALASQGPRVSCCPTASTDCSGCKYFRHGCQARQAAFMKFDGEGVHSACMDISGWVNEEGLTCQQIEASTCSVSRVQGSSSKEACCKCGGGIRTPTPFKYEDWTYTLSEPVRLYPKPRTATSYGLAEDCEFAKYGLTLVGGTGEVKYAAGVALPTQPFKITCKVTAFQTDKITYTADVTVEASDLTWRSSVLVFSKHKSRFGIAVPSHWGAKDFKITCAPDAPWLDLQSSGALALKTGSEEGIVDDVKDIFRGQRGAVCQITANIKPKGSSEWAKRSQSVVVVRPKAATTLRYRTNRLQGSISQVVPPVLPLDFGEGVMAPSQYDMACDKGEFKFDIMHGVGYYEGHPLLELQSNGQLSLNVGPSFARVFLPKRGHGSDTLFIAMNCRIVGSFPDGDFDPIQTTMQIIVLDSTCWSKEKIRAREARVRKPNERECQYSCRRESKCAAYRWSNACFFSSLGNSDAPLRDVWSKVSDCEPTSTCVSVTAPKWLHRGTYCPVGYDTDRGGMVYLKEGKSARETLYLRKYKAKSPFLFDPPDSARAYSSVHNNDRKGTGHAKGRLSSSLGWAPKHRQKNQFMDIDLGKEMLVAGVATKGRRDHGQWVTQWIVQTGTSKQHLREPPGGRGGNHDRNTQKDVFFREPVMARYIRLVIRGWHGWPTMRAGVWLAHEIQVGADEPVSGCEDGEWLIQEKHPDDFQNLQKGFFEFAGPTLGCTTTKVGYTSLSCDQPPNITEEDADIQPMVLDDPATGPPADYWLHPCDCAPKAWGENPPVDPLIYAQLPPDSPDNFVPSPLVVVEGEFVCSPSALIGAPLFETDTATMEAGDCEVKCKNNDACSFFWHGAQHSASTCRLYKSCDNLLREPGVEGVLMALPKTPACLVSSPEECWTKSLRRKALTTEGQQQFLYWNLHVQCDYMLLLGGMGVSHCARPSFREIDSHAWKHKRLLPESFAHGTQLKATCWSERYRGITAFHTTGEETVTCVNGNWFNSQNYPAWGDFKCYSCVQVGTHGFMDAEKKRQQEMYFFNRMALQLHSEVSPSASGTVKCLDAQKPVPVEKTDLPKALADKAVAWYRSEDAGTKWKSRVGNAQIKLFGETGRVYTYTAKGFGAKAPVKYLLGNDKSSVQFPGALKGKYTVCSVTRYTNAANMQRILTGDKSNFLTGQHGGFTGVAYGDGWLTKSERGYKSTKWVVMCTSPGADYTMVDGLKVGTGKTNRYTSQDLVINRGKFGSQTSHWAVMELITWDYVLSQSEMESVSQYLLKKMNLGDPERCRVKLWNPPPALRLQDPPGVAGRKNSQLHSEGWCAEKSAHAYVLFRFKEPTTVMGVIIQGVGDNHVREFKIGWRLGHGHFSMKTDWRPLTGLSGAAKTDEPVRVYLESPVTADSFRIQSLVHTGDKPCMRVALMLCNPKLDNEVQLVDDVQCPTTYTSESWSESDPASRHLRVGGRDDCLMPHQLDDPDQMTIVYNKCEPKNVHQMMPASYMGYLFTTILRNARLNGESLQPGIKAEYFFHMDSAAKANCKFPELHFVTPHKVETVSQLKIYKKTDTGLGPHGKDYYAARYTGMLMINKPGRYTFWIWADDSATMYFNHKKVISIDGCGGTRSGDSGFLDLIKGNYPFEVLFLESTGEASVQMNYRGPDTNSRIVTVPPSVLAHIPDASEWTPSPDVAKGCIGNTALGSLNPSLFLLGNLAMGSEMDCRFVPLLAQDAPVEIETQRSFKDAEKWPEWWEDIETWEIQCPPGRVLQTIDFLKVKDKLRIKYVCGVAAGLGQCYPSWTDQQDAREFKDTFLSKSVLARLNIMCPGHDLLSGLHFEYSMGGLWARFKYTCCKESGAPVATVSRGPNFDSLDRLEGPYCPEKLGATGRVDYKQQEYGGHHANKQLTFSEDSGKWCIDGECSEEGDSFDPIGLRLGKLEAAAVSDFDGKFEAKGVSANPGKASQLSSTTQVRPPRPPRRPKAPKKPKLEKFEAEMPKYSDKCVGYGDLWKKLQETKLDVTGEELAETEEVGTDEEAAAGFKEKHPCDLAGADTGTRSKWAGGDGKKIPDNMGYNELEGCFDRSGSIAHKIAKHLDMADLVITKMGVSFSLASTLCSFLPDTMAAPMGFGISLNPSEICDKSSSVGQAGLEFSKELGVHDVVRKMRTDAATKDCKPNQANFARIFCDVHCVRDAVVRGDRTILRNLERATGITNKNMQKLSEWVVNTQKLDVGWLADKVDHQTKLLNLANQKEFAQLKELVGGDKKLLFLTMQQETRKIQSELRGYALGASFSRAATVAANDALEKFADDGASALQESNASDHVFAAFDSLVSLKEKLQTASDQRKKVDYVAMSASRMARQMQEQLKLQRQTLGIYKRKSNATRQMVRHRGSAAMAAERHAMLLDLDRVWWKIRNVLDDYMDDAGSEIDSYEMGSNAVAQYEGCAMDFASLLSIYKQTMSMTDRAHRSLKKTWRHVSNLLGELASHLEDGEAFVTFLQQEGCESPMAFQTLEQVRDATSGMRMLYHRFAVSGLPQPTIELMETTVGRIKSSWANAQQSVCNHQGELPHWYMPSVASVN